MLRSVIVSFGVLIALSQGQSVWAAAGEVPDVEAAEPREHSGRSMLEAMKDKLAYYKEQYPHVREEVTERNVRDLFDCISAGGKFSDLTPDELKVTADAIAQLAAHRQAAEMSAADDDSDDTFPFPLLPYASDKMVIWNISLFEIVQRFSGVSPEERLRSAKQCALEVYKARWRCEADDSKNPELPKQYNQESDFDRFDHDVQSFLPYIDAYFKELQTRAEADEKQDTVKDGVFNVVNKGGITTVQIVSPEWMNHNHLYVEIKDGCIEPFGGCLVDTPSALVVFQQGGGVYRIIPDPDTGFKQERIGDAQETFADHWRPQSEEEDKTYFWTNHLIPGSGPKAKIQHSVLYTIDSNGDVSPGTIIPPVSLDNDLVTSVLENSGYLLVDNGNDTRGFYNVQTGNAVQGLESFTGSLLTHGSEGSDGYGVMIWSEELGTVTKIPHRNAGIGKGGIKTMGMTKKGKIFVPEYEEEGYHDKFQLDDGSFFVISEFEPRVLFSNADPSDGQVLDELGPFETPASMLVWLDTQEENYKAAEKWIKSLSQKSGKLGDGTANEEKGNESEESESD